MAKLTLIELVEKFLDYTALRDAERKYNHILCEMLGAVKTIIIVIIMLALFFAAVVS